MTDHCSGYCNHNAEHLGLIGKVDSRTIRSKLVSVVELGRLALEGYKS